MPMYLVERNLPGVTLPQLRAMRRATAAACDRFTTNEMPVRYVHTTFVPGESRCLCLFEAPDMDSVQKVNEDAQIPYARIVIALDLNKCDHEPE